MIFRLACFMLILLVGVAARAGVLQFPDRHAETFSAKLVGTYEFQDPSTGGTRVATIRRERDHLTLLWIEGDGLRGQFFPLESAVADRSVDSDGFTHYETEVVIEPSRLRSVLQKQNAIRKLEETSSLSLVDGHLTVVVTRALLQRRNEAAPWESARATHPDGMFTRSLSMGFLKTSNEPMSFNDLDVIAKRNRPALDIEPARERSPESSTSVDTTQPLAEVFNFGEARCASLFH